MPVVCDDEPPPVSNQFFTGLLNAIVIEGVLVAIGWAIWTYIL